MSVPSLPFADQNRTASAPYCSINGIGVMATPRDLLIFLRSGSTMNPEIMASRQGMSLWCNAAFTMV